MSSDIADIAGSDKLILAGVGHFERAMAGLRKPGLLDALEKAVLIDRKPVLGICLGMELMAKSSEEGMQRALAGSTPMLSDFGCRTSSNIRSLTLAGIVLS